MPPSSNNNTNNNSTNTTTTTSNSAMSQIVPQVVSAVGGGAEDTLQQHHFVLTWNGEPTQVGCGKLCHGGSPLEALQAAVRYAEEALKIPLEKDHLVICSGACPRTPVQPGLYHLNWGLLGATSCTVK